MNGIHSTQVIVPMNHHITIDEIADLIQVAVDNNQKVFNSCYDKYDEIKNTVGGCIVHINSDAYVNSWGFLCHRDLQPSINSSFLTFKCPYKNDIITINIKNKHNIRIERMDEFHTIETQRILLG